MIKEGVKMYLEYMRENEIIELPTCERCGDECCVGYDDVVHVDLTDEYYCSVECYFELIGAKLI